MNSNTLMRLVLLTTSAVLVTSTALAVEGSDTGYSMLLPTASVKTTKPDGGVSTRNTHKGFAVTDNKESPLHNARMDCETTMVDDSSGTQIFEYITCNFMQADGDEAYMFVAFSPEMPPNMKFFGGTGKWKGLTGTLENTGEPFHWPDESGIYVNWAITWSTP